MQKLVKKDPIKILQVIQIKGRIQDFNIKRLLRLASMNTIVICIVFLKTFS